MATKKVPQGARAPKKRAEQPTSTDEIRRAAERAGIDALAPKVAAQLTALKEAISNARRSPTTAGRAQAAIQTALAGWPESAASGRLSAE